MGFDHITSLLSVTVFTRACRIQIARHNATWSAGGYPQNILHRDIKPENILLMDDGDVRLADLGLALDLAVDQPRSCVGTLDYMPPEARHLR